MIVVWFVLKQGPSRTNHGREINLDLDEKMKIIFIMFILCIMFSHSVSINFHPFPAFQSISNYFQPFLDVSSNFQPFPASLAISSHFQQLCCHFMPFPTIQANSSNVQPFTVVCSHIQPCPAISAISSHFQPFQPFFSHI